MTNTTPVPARHNLTTITVPEAESGYYGDHIYILNTHRKYIADFYAPDDREEGAVFHCQTIGRYPKQLKKEIEELHKFGGTVNAIYECDTVICPDGEIRDCRGALAPFTRPECMPFWAA